MLDRVFQLLPSGNVRVHLGGEEREFLANLLRDATVLVDEDERSMWRLFPPIYEDASLQAGAELSSELFQDRSGEIVKELDLCRDLLEHAELDREEADQLLRGLNRLRLVLAGILRIDVDGFELPQDSSESAKLTYDLYNFLSWLMSALIDELPT
ncbi:MAG: DUF2017 family protein [Acidimicrobiales bacterium]